MDISSARPAAPGGVDSRAPAQARPRPAADEVKERPLGVPASQHEPAQAPGQRLADAARSIDARLQNLIGSGELSAAQIEALSAAGDEFLSSIQRLAGAMEQGGPPRGTLQRGFQMILRDLRAQVHSTLRGQRPAGSAGAEPDAPAPASAVGGDEGSGPGTAGVERRLASVQQGIEQRLANLVSSGKLERETAAALRSAQAEFSATLQRLHDALTGDGGVSRDTLSLGFSHALQTLRNQVHALFGGQVQGLASAPDAGQDAHAVDHLA